MERLAKPAAAVLLLGCLLLVMLTVPAARASGPTPAIAHAASAGTAHKHVAGSHRRAAGCSARRTSHRRHACRAKRRRHHTKAPSVSAKHSTVEAAASASAAAVAAILAAPCQNTQLTPEAADMERVRAAVLCLINQTRAQHGVAPLKLSGQLDAAAESHAGELIADDYFAHVSPTGETPVDRVRTTGYIPGPSAGYVIGENLAWGTYGLATPQAIVAAWTASPGHLANILEGQYRETGIGIAPSVPSSLANGAPGATYAQEFGAIVG